MKTSFNRVIVAAAIFAAVTCVVGYGRQKQGSNGKYAEVNGLKMYYEIHGSGQPLVLLHGAFGFVGSCAGKIKDVYDPEIYKQFQCI